LEQLNAALSADPLSVDVRRSLAWVQVSAGRYDDAIANCRRVLAADPDSLHERQVLARALLQKGHTNEAIEILEKLGTGSEQFLGYAYARSGRRAEAETLAAAFTDRPSRDVVIYAGLGDKDRLLDALEKMAAQKDPRLGAYLTYPELALLRGDPRLAAFRKKLGLPGQ
jgi:tetratricopeptide (TPR) repeat protein